MSLLKAYGAELKRIRESRGLSLETVADKLNLVPQQVQRTEEGLSDISLDNLKKYAELYGVNTTDVTDTITLNETPDSLGAVKGLIELFFANKHLYERGKCNNE